MLSDFTAVANAISQTTKKSVKERLLADYLAPDGPGADEPWRPADAQTTHSS
jgi:hypothetical protein